MRILYVEDNETNQALVERVARARRHTVIFREEGEGALDVLAQDPAISLILLDIELAGSMSGLDVIQAIRARHDPRPVIAVTAYAMMGDRERILEAGCDQYLPKPLVITDLLALLDHYEHTLAAPPPAATPVAVELSAPAAESAAPAGVSPLAAEPAAPLAAQPVSVPAAAVAAEAVAAAPVLPQPAATSTERSSDDSPH